MKAEDLQGLKNDFTLLSCEGPAGRQASYFLYNTFRSAEMRFKSIWPVDVKFTVFIVRIGLRGVFEAPEAKMKAGRSFISGERPAVN